DALAGFAAAMSTIGFESNTENIPQRYKNKTDKFYSQLLQLPATAYFEFERSKFFFDSVLNTVNAISSTALPVAKVHGGSIVLFPGAGAFGREWGRRNFIDLIKQIKQHTTQPVYLAGGPGEAALGEFIVAGLPSGSVVNLIGQSSLPQLIELIGRAAL